MNFEQVWPYLRDGAMVRRTAWAKDITIGMHDETSFFMHSKGCYDTYKLSQFDGGTTDWEIPKIEVWWWPVQAATPIEVVIKIGVSGDAYLMSSQTGYKVGQRIYFYCDEEKDCYHLPQQEAS